MADRDTASWPDWYLAGTLRGIADLVRQGVDDPLLLRAWKAYVAAAVVRPFDDRDYLPRLMHSTPPGL